MVMLLLHIAQLATTCVFVCMLWLGACVSIFIVVWVMANFFTCWCYYILLAGPCFYVNIRVAFAFFWLIPIFLHSLISSANLGFWIKKLLLGMTTINFCHINLMCILKQCLEAVLNTFHCYSMRLIKKSRNNFWVPLTGLKKSLQHHLETMKMVCEFRRVHTFY